MRIIFAVHQFFPEHYAGTEVLTLGLAKELRKRGHETFVFAAKRSAPVNAILPGEIEDYEVEGVPVRRVGRSEEGLSKPYVLEYRNEVMAYRAREYVREVRPDVVHAMHFQGLSASVIPAFKEFGAPLVYTATDFWTVCPVVDLMRHDGVMCEGPEVSHCVRCIASRNPDPRVRSVAKVVPGPVVKAADLISRVPLSRRSFSLRQIGAVGERPTRIRENMELVDRFVAYTGLTRDLLAANGVGAGRWMVSPYGIDTSRVAPAAGLRRPSRTLRLGYVGTLAPHKGCDVLVRAFRSLPPDIDATLSIHGDPKGYEPFFEELRALAGDDHRIAFCGPFARDEIGRVLSGTDVLIVPSRWYENAPGVVFEAFAAGAPVVATDLGGLSEFVHHDANGLLFELENADDLTLQLERLVAEPGLLGRLREGIGPVKTVGEYAGELEELYASLVGGV